jgi:MHS family metabolite:H+ symporter-like MFS transporter
MTDSWLPVVVMLICYSVIGLLAAILMPEVRDRDLSLANDAADTLPLRKDEKSGQYI